MTEWAVSGDHGLLATWPTPVARQAELVAEDAAAEPEKLQLVAQILTDLSGVIWRIHQLPWVVTVGEPSRGELVEQLGALLAEELVTGRESPPQTSELLDSAANLGAELYEACDELPPAVASAVRREIHQEIEALRDAVGDRFDGRAAQALCAPRPSASPTQVEKAACILLRRRYDMLPFELATEVEPASAAVAAGEWFAAALQIVSSQLGYQHLRTVLLAANDQLGPLPLAVLSSVADQLEAGIDPATAVELLLNDAYLAQSGWALALVPIAADVAPRQRTWTGLGRYTEPADESGLARISTLDPERCGPELLVALVAGVAACRDLYVADANTFGRTDRAAVLDEFFERLSAVVVL